MAKKVITQSGDNTPCNTSCEIQSKISNTVIQRDTITPEETVQEYQGVLVSSQCKLIVVH